MRQQRRVLEVRRGVQAVAAVIVPRATVEASRTVTTVPVPPERSVPSRSTALPVPSITIVPDVVPTVCPVACVTPRPVSPIVPEPEKT